MRAGALSGTALPRSPPLESYTAKDMIQLLRSFSSDGEGKGNRGIGRAAEPDREISNPTEDTCSMSSSEIYDVLLGMDGSLGSMRLDCDDINNVIRRWELDVGFDMNGRCFQESPFAIVKRFVAPNAALDDIKMCQWVNLAHHMGLELKVLEPRNWRGSETLADAADVLTLLFNGK